MASEMNRDPENVSPMESSSGANVDSAIVDARGRVSLLKDRLKNLSQDILRSGDVDVQEAHNQNKTAAAAVPLPISHSVEAQSSPQSSDFSGDLPESLLGNKSQEKTSFRHSSREESIELDSQWRESEAGTFSDDHEHYHRLQEMHDGSSASSRSWSTGRPIGFGVSASDQLMLRKLSQSGGGSGAASHLKFEAPVVTTDVVSAADLQVSSRPTRRQSDDDPQTWVLNSLLPHACWPKEEAVADLRLTGRDGHLRVGPGSRRSQINQGTHVQVISQAVRDAIGKMWDDTCLETAQDIWQLVTELLSSEEDDTIDPDYCWVSGRALHSVSNALPFAFTIHTFSSTCKPCTFGHANVLAEVTTVTQQLTAGNDDQSPILKSETGAYNMVPVPVDKYLSPEPVSPNSEHAWDHSNVRGGVSKERATTSSSKEPMIDTHSSFSFTSRNREERRETQPGSISTDTETTADLSHFIRGSEDGRDRMSQPQGRLGQLQPRGARHEALAPINVPRASARELDPPAEVFSEEDLIWEMHYPDLTKLDTVIASRKVLLSDDRDWNRTYLGDTDTESSDDHAGQESSHMGDLFRPESPSGSGGGGGGGELEASYSRALVVYNEENNETSGNPFQRQLFDSDPWVDIATASSKSAELTISMEVNVGDDDEDSGKKLNRRGKFSSLLRRVRRMIGNSNAEETHRMGETLPTIPDGRELEEPGEDDLSGYYTCETPSPTPTPTPHSTPLTPGQERSPVHESPDRSKRSPLSLPIGSMFDNAPATPAAVTEHKHDGLVESDSGRAGSDSGLLSEQNFMLAPHTSLVSGNFDATQDSSRGSPRSISLPVKDLGNGRYLAMGHLSGPGQYKLTVKIGKKKIRGVPKTISVVDPITLGSGIASDGPFFQRPESPVFPSTSTMLSPHPEFPPCHSVTYDPERLDYAQKHGHIGDVDMLFIVDCTASMGAELRQLPLVVEKIEELIKETALCRRLRMAVIGYRDHHPEDEDNFLLRKQDFTENIDRVKHFISGLEADGKNDYPDAMEVAFEEAVEGVRWSLFSARFIVWVGDAPPHGYQGFKHKEAQEEARKFKDAKTRLKKAAYAVDVAMMNEASPRSLGNHDRELADALEVCESMGKFYDKYPLGIPGRVRWEEAVERVSSIGARVLALGLRSAVRHQASSSCLRTIAHVSGGALLEVSALDASVIGPLTVAIVEQALDQQLVEEEVCDLILCFKNDFERQSPEDRLRNLAERMSQSSKDPHRLQVFSNSSAANNQLTRTQSAAIPGSQARSDAVSSGLFRPDSRTSSGGGGGLGTLSISRSSFDATTSRDLSPSGDSRSDGHALLLGMSPVRFDTPVVDQVLESIRNKAERTSRCLLSNFESPEQWFSFHTRQTSDGLYRRERNKVLGLTSPLSLRYIIATHIMAADTC